MRRECTAALLACAALAAHAQLATPDPDWAELDVPAPPAVQLDGLIALDQPGSALRFGVMPSSISIGKDGIVRYVVVAKSASGAMNAMYEGIRCNTGEFRVYARYNPQGPVWTPAKDAPWRSLHESRPSRHTLTIARTGACVGDGANRSAERIVRDLRGSVDHRFE